ncbi:hypothetical protein [Mesorhizobium sp. M7A.F.Ca.CA.004.02.1.1]|uniref:hypothetical protein n=1 Tax=Mesorhizobium sp. M7A.F.Ca.CA.004.02.1.1 TaxID=2496690 RepID=UPI000FD3E6DF|nr:hypothetical protein [Mesorhizobium sp. M7A.F.Ca.CA.004.02.1.1]RVB05696.1 hypothetical protein EN912_02215 [Mesorhizobium sp. M7A.F.Ca.CA.004.02.1.1]
MPPKHSRRYTSKVWLAVCLVLSFVALFFSLFKGLETASVGITVMIPAVFGFYVTIGHMDLKEALTNPQEGGETVTEVAAAVA